MKRTAQPQRSGIRRFSITTSVSQILAVLVMVTFGATEYARAQTFTILHTFSGSDGYQPLGNLVRDAAGNLYGTTRMGGDLRCGRVPGCGEVFVISNYGEGRELYDFRGGTDGTFPEAGLVRDPATGMLYGTTRSGGEHDLGTIFQLDRNGTKTILHSFSGEFEGQASTARLLLQGGNLYGIAAYGGAFFFGSVYSLNLKTNEYKGVFMYFYQAAPVGGLTMGADANLYGSAAGAGGYGFIYKLTSHGDMAAVYTFVNGDVPLSPLVFDAAGNLYGTTWYGGLYSAGGVFKLDPSGVLTNLYTFTGGLDGGHPRSGVALDADGNLYGSAEGGAGCGVVFKLDSSGQQTVLHTFDAQGSDGCMPNEVLLGADGVLYGTTSTGGQFKAGTVFAITP